MPDFLPSTTSVRAGCPQCAHTSVVIKFLPCDPSLISLSSVPLSVSQGTLQCHGSDSPHCFLVLNEITSGCETKASSHVSVLVNVFGFDFFCVFVLD